MLNWTHIHLMINHLPVIGLAVPIALLLVDRARKNRKLEWLGLQMFVAFALLAYETWNRRPSNVPSATGARRPAILGKISYA